VARTPALDATAVEARYAHEFARTPAPDAAPIEAHYNGKAAIAQPAKRVSALYQIIRQELRSPTNAGLTFQQIRGARKAIRYQSIIGLATAPYKDILHCIQDACRQHEFSRPMDGEDAWLAAIDAARACTVLSGNLPDFDLRVDAVTEAAKRLRDDGYLVRVKNDQLDLEPGHSNRLYADIEADVRLLGGGSVLIQKFGFLHESKQYEFERYIPGRNLNNRPREPSFPGGYLLNLGIKHLNSAPLSDQRAAARIWHRVAKRARDLCALYDVEPYHNIENTVLAPRDVPTYLGSVALFDHVFALRQWRPSETVGLLQGLLAFVDSKTMEDMLGWTLNEACLLAETVVGLSHGHDMCAIGENQITSRGLKAERWLRMRRHFVHNFGEANRDYVKPVDADKSDFGSKPLIEIHKKNVLLVSPSLCMLAFFEAVTCALRAAGYPRFDQDLGNVIERVVADTIRAHRLNVTIQGGTYKMLDPVTGKNQVGECDVMVEGPDFIIFIETKKKPHRRVSATGDALANLIDLSGSLFDAQAQLARHERILLHHRHILFDDGTRLDHNGRNSGNATRLRRSAGQIPHKAAFQRDGARLAQCARLGPRHG
jgi:hypothetical protein